MMTPLHRHFRARVLLALVLLPVFALPGGAVARAADLPFAGDDTFQSGPVTLADGESTTLLIDRAYGPLADAAGHLTPTLLGHSVSATATLDVAPVNGATPDIAIAFNGVDIPGAWDAVPGEPGVFRLSVPTQALQFPQPGDALHPLVPQANTVTVSGDAASLAWLRLTVAGAPPVLFMAGLDLDCAKSGPQPVSDTFRDWGRWLGADGVTYTAPDRDGHLDIAEQLPFLDAGYAALWHTYGPDRPDLVPRVTLVGYSMGGLVAREWALAHPGAVARFVAISTPNSGTPAADNALAPVLAHCATAALHDLTPEFVSGFNTRFDLTHYWSPTSASDHVVSLAATPAIGNLTDGLVTKDSALALPYGQKLVWSPAQGARVLSLHQAVMHTPQVYADVRAATHFDQPLPDPRSGAPAAH